MDTQLTASRAGTSDVSHRSQSRVAVETAILAVLVAVGFTVAVLSGFPPAVVDAQPAPRVRVGILSAGGARERPTIAAFVQRLRDLGYIEGRNLTVDFRDGDDNVTRLSELARELVRLRPDVILATTTPTPAIAAMKVTSKIPIVFVHAADPVRAGLVASLGRPGGNVTGVSSMNARLDAKRLELIAEIVPGVRRVTVLVLPSDPETPTMLGVVEAAARDRGIQLQRLEIHDLARLDSAISDATRAGTASLLVLGSPAFYRHQLSLAQSAARHRMAVVSAWRELPEAGGLASYGTGATELFQRAAGLVDRILKGSKPAELPVEQPTTFELVINARAARALGLTIPPNVLVRADRVIE
jgi:putative ABC transport system substrate-binding protein